MTERFGFGGGRDVGVYVPSGPVEAVVYAGDGQLIAPWGADVDGPGGPATLVVGVHRADDETERLHEYSPGFDPARFEAHERFVVEEVGGWVRSAFGVDLAAERTAVCGVSAGGELALALGMRHPDVVGSVLCASPGAGYRPPEPLPDHLPRTYLVAGTEEPFFRENAERWATALDDAGAEVVMAQRVGGHGGAFWRDEFPAMVAWAFDR